MVLQPPFGLPDLNDIPGTPVYASMASLATGSPPGHSVFQRNIVHGTYTFADTTSHTTIFQGEVQVRATEKGIEQPFVQQIRQPAIRERLFPFAFFKSSIIREV